MSTPSADRRATSPAAPRRRAHEVARPVALLLAALGFLRAAPALADLGNLGDLTVGLGASIGFQPDGRACSVGGDARNFPGTGTCVLFAGGFDASFLWRGRIGAAIGVWSVAGQAAVAQKPTQESPDPPGFPDRVSVPLLLDVRPLAFLVARDDRGYLARFLHGVRLGLGPSFELVRTSQLSSLDWGDRIGSRARASLGMHATLDGEVPLHAAADVSSGLSLRISLRLLYVPVVTLQSENGSQVFSHPITLPEGDEAAADRFHGLGARAQLFLGLVYYM
jgi:hypothetical protein